MAFGPHSRRHDFRSVFLRITAWLLLPAFLTGCASIRPTAFATALPTLLSAPAGQKISVAVKPVTIAHAKRSIWSTRYEVDTGVQTDHFRSALEDTGWVRVFEPEGPFVSQSPSYGIALQVEQPEEIELGKSAAQIAVLTFSFLCWTGIPYTSKVQQRGSVKVYDSDGGLVKQVERTATTVVQFSIYHALQGETYLKQVSNEITFSMMQALAKDAAQIIVEDAPKRGITPLRREPREEPSFGRHYGRRVAVVIGINEYLRWPALEGAVTDARRMAETFRQMGFSDVIEVYNKEATRARLLELLGTELAEKTSRDDLAVIFFAGHGQTETLANGQKRGYLIPVDADREQVFATAISMEILRDLSNRIPAKHIYYAMDSCYSGLGFVRGAAPVRKTQGFIQKMVSRRAVQMITAGSEGEQVLELGGQGLFTTKLIEAFRGEADFDGDEVVTASEVGTYVRPQVTGLSNELQTPQFGTLEGSGEVVFSVPAESRG